jgi:hypothetical protein
MWGLNGSMAAPSAHLATAGLVNVPRFRGEPGTSFPPKLIPRLLSRSRARMSALPKTTRQAYHADYSANCLLPDEHLRGADAHQK